MNIFPKEILEKQFFYSIYEEVLEKANLTEQGKDIITRNTFWQNWLNYKYKLNLVNETLNYKKLAEKASILLYGIKRTKIILSSSSFAKLILYFSKDHIKYYFEERYPVGEENIGISTFEQIYYDLQDSFSLNYNLNEMNKDIVFDFEQGVNLNNYYSRGSIVSRYLTDTGKRNYKKILDKVLTPTTYILPNGELKVVDYNADVDRWAKTVMCEFDDTYVDALWNSLGEIEDAIVMRYFM
jgi:hypothetical protein